MNQELAVQVVRKAKAKKSHLTVPASEKSDIRTLCGVEMKAGDYEVVAGEADCQPCLRKKGNRAFISSAYFAQDAGSRLLELSLEQAKQGRADRRPRIGGKLRAGAKPKTAAKPPSKRDRPEPPDDDALSDDELRALGLEALKRVGLDVYQTPLGVLVRLHREGKGWRIAEVTFDGPSSLTARTSERNTMVIGDVRLEEAGGALKLKLMSRPRT